MWSAKQHAPSWQDWNFPAGKGWMCTSVLLFFFCASSFLQVICGKFLKYLQNGFQTQTDKPLCFMRSYSTLNFTVLFTVHRLFALWKDLKAKLLLLKLLTCTLSVAARAVCVLHNELYGQIPLRTLSFGTMCAKSAGVHGVHTWELSFVSCFELPRLSDDQRGRGERC